VACDYRRLRGREQINKTMRDDVCMNAREKVGVSLHFIAVALAAGMLAYFFWAVGHDSLAFTNEQAEIIIGSTVAILMVGSLLIKGRPVTEVLRAKRKAIRSSTP
jgi:hypothetical protein